MTERNKRFRFTGDELEGELARPQPQMTEARLSEPQSSGNPAESLEQLADWAWKRDCMRADVERLTGYMQEQARKAKAAGATGEQIAQAAGMSRQAVYKLMS